MRLRMISTKSSYDRIINWNIHNVKSFYVCTGSQWSTTPKSQYKGGGINLIIKFHKENYYFNEKYEMK